MEEFVVDKDTMDTDSLEIEATQLSGGPTKLDLSKGGLSRIPESILAFSATEEILLEHNRLANPNSNLKILHKVVGASKCDFAGPFEQQDRASARRDPSTCQTLAIARRSVALKVRTLNFRIHRKVWRVESWLHDRRNNGNV
ncbi:hypothetical protein PV326_003545, partial [Microctonus aethiopoides]